VGRLSGAILSFVLLVACAHTTERGLVTFGGVNASDLHVDIADSPSEREHGLMGVTELPADDGMAFVWDDPTTATFWMKDTLIPLSVAFVDAGGRIVSIEDMEPCHAEPCPTYVAAGPYTLAVEANRGWFADHGIEVGDRASLEEAVA
jgi:uncharacterized protein